MKQDQLEGSCHSHATGGASTHSFSPRMMNTIEVAETLVQLEWGLRLTLAAICQIHPVVLILDDLQWADRAALNVVSSVSTCEQLSNFFLLGTHRDNEVTERHVLNPKLPQILRDSATATP